MRWRKQRDAEVAVQLPEPLRLEVEADLAEHGEVHAVRLVRSRTGLNLTPAVRAVRNLRTSVDDA